MLDENEPKKEETRKKTPLEMEVYEKVLDFRLREAEIERIENEIKCHKAAVLDERLRESFLL